MNENRPDSLVLFRQTATSMSAAILLITIGKPIEVNYLGGIFLIFAVIFLLASLGQVSSKLQSITNWIRNLGDNLTFSFILVTLVSIIRVLLDFIKEPSNINLFPYPIVTFVRSISPSIILAWFYAFAIIFVIVSFYESTRNIKSLYRRAGKRDASLRLILSAIPSIGWAFVIFTSTNISTNISINKWYLIAIWALVTIACFIYLNLTKKQKGRSQMERKEKVRESAIAVATIAKFIGDSMTYDIPVNILKATVNVPLKQLEDEVTTLKAYVDALK